MRILHLAKWVVGMRRERRKIREEKKNTRIHTQEAAHSIASYVRSLFSLLRLLFFFNLFSTVNGILWKIYAFAWHGTAINSETSINAITKTEDAFHEICCLCTFYEKHLSQFHSCGSPNCTLWQNFWIEWTPTHSFVTTAQLEQIVNMFCD